MDPLTYKASGVDIEAGEEVVRRIAPLAASTFRPEVLGAIGAFAGFFRIPTGYREPVLVASTDGVGTKVKVAVMLDRHDTVGIFNMGIGFIVVAPAHAAEARRKLESGGERVFEIGEVRSGSRGVEYVGGRAGR